MVKSDDFSGSRWMLISHSPSYTCPEDSPRSESGRRDFSLRSPWWMGWRIAVCVHLCALHVAPYQRA